MGLKEPNSKLIRWRLKLEDIDYEIVYKKGAQNTNADALSRIKTDINNYEAFQLLVLVVAQCIPRKKTWTTGFLYPKND